MYVVILAGGGGTRLWPLSRPDRPKPFLPLIGDETLFQRTVARVRAVVDSDDDIYCVTDRRYGHFVQSQAPGVRLIVEPAAKNTAAAIALATASIHRPDDDVMAVLPADHWIRDEAAFGTVLAAAEGELAAGSEKLGIAAPLVTLGVHVDRPATEYGYLLPDLDRRQRGELTAYVLRAFEEKPTAARAAELQNEPGVAWNAGIFLWQRGAIAAALAKYTPLPMLIDQAVGSDLALNGAYDRITPISIDKAVMEGAAADHRVVMGAMNVGWSDLGSWTALLGAIAGDELRGATGRVVQSGEPIPVVDGDLVIRTVDGRLTVGRASDVTPAVDGTIVADGVWAHLAGAGHLLGEVRGLLERVEHEEVRA
jgi:mannose-1-phosphate guanylyltransferase/mannose-1-phosphate guanylyltransferase/mannose-6-phosphate isomerase